MKDYHKEYSNYYDILTQHKNYRSEVELLVSFLSKYGFDKNSKFLSVGCGIGKHENILAKYFEKIVAIDNSEHMIANAKILNSHKNIEFSSCNLESLHSDKFDIAISLFNVINCIENSNSLASFISDIANKLNKGGLFIFEVWNKSAIELSPPKSVTRKYENKNLFLLRVAKPNFILNKSLIILDYNIKGIDKDQKINIKSTHNIYLHSRIKIENILRENGFGEFKWFTALSDGLKKLKDIDRMALCLAKKI